MKAIAKFFVVALLIGATASASFASPVPGPQGRVTSVNARTSDVYHVTLRGGETTTISIVGDGDTDLDLWVFDMAGNLIINATGNSDRESVNIRPGSTQTFRVEVRNLGSTWNQYRIEMR